MFRLAQNLLLALAAMAIAVYAQGDERKRQQEAARRVAALQVRFRTLERKASPARPPRMSILREASRVGGDAAFQFMSTVAQSRRHLDLRGELLELLARIGDQSGIVAALFRTHMGANDPYRRMSRDFLLRRAIQRRDHEWLNSLFNEHATEDEFLALRGLGRIGHVSVLEKAWAMLRDPNWKPQLGGVIGCGTLARSVRAFEGGEAARLLLLLQRDPRFRPADLAVIRETTRLWASRDLRRYIKLSALAHPEAPKRAEAAHFMGAAGIEAARAPLMFLARQRGELAVVRAAATEALGGLTLSRADLARELSLLAQDEERLVSHAAIAGLARLRVEEAARVLVGMLGTPLDAPSRTALARAFGKAERHDWTAWLAKCSLPKGT